MLVKEGGIMPNAHKKPGAGPGFFILELSSALSRHHHLHFDGIRNQI